MLGGYGINIVSTSKGLMSGKRARRENIGGELLAHLLIGPRLCLELKESYRGA